MSAEELVAADLKGRHIGRTVEVGAATGHVRGQLLSLEYLEPSVERASGGMQPSRRVRTRDLPYVRLLVGPWSGEVPGETRVVVDPPRWAQRPTS